MTKYSVRAVDVADDVTVPGRIHEGGVREVALAMGAEDDEDADGWELLRRAFEPLSVQDLGERLLDAVLLQPPIPAYCETLLRRMQDPESSPWVDHEVTEDRFHLWYCHHLVHRAFPDRWPAPPIRRVRLEIMPLDAEGRPPGRRSTARDRTAFVARLLRARPGDNPIRDSVGAGDAPAATHAVEGGAEWAFDMIWGTEVGNWERVEDVAGLSAAPGFSPFRVTMDAWLPPQWIGDLAAGTTWTAELD